MEDSLAKRVTEDAETIMGKVKSNSNLIISPYVQIDDRMSYGDVKYGVKVFLDGHHLHLVDMALPEYDRILVPVHLINFKDEKNKMYKNIMEYSEKLKNHLEKYNVKIADLKIENDQQIFG